MKNTRYFTSTVSKFAHTQLKAYYVAKIEINVQEFLLAVLDQANQWLLCTPDWLLPLCSAIAGVAVIVSIGIKAATWLLSKWPR